MTATKESTIDKAEYKYVTESLRLIQKLPPEAQHTIFNMLQGAVVISELYRENSRTSA